MSEDERQPLVVHANPRWRSGNRSSVEASGDYTPITPPTSGLHVNRDYVHSISSSSNTPRSTAANDNKPKEKKRFNCTVALCGASGTILTCVALERLAFYGLVGNLVLFLNKSPFFWESYNAMNTSFVFIGIAYVMSLISGWVADSLLGRYKTLLIAFIIYLCGIMIMPFLASSSGSPSANQTMTLPPICASSSNITEADTESNPFEERCAWLIYVTLIVIAIGCGSLKSNICPFGSDQLVGASPNVQFSFFNWYYWCVNLGSVLAFCVVAYIEQQLNFQIGFIICTVALGSAFIIFLSGTCFYKIRPPDGSVLTNILRIIRVAWRIKKQRQKERRLNARIAECSDMHEMASQQEKISFLDHAKHRYGGIYHSSLVEDVKKLKMILAVFGVSIPYWLVYMQMQTTFLFQGLHMRLGSGSPHTVNTSNASQSVNSPESGNHKNSPVLVAAWFSLFDAVTVIILLPLFDRLIYPFLERRGYPFTFSKRILIGMVFALVAMLVAGVVEHHRLKAYWPYPDEPCVSLVINQEIGNTLYQAADMSVFWQIPQYVLIGVSEVFASVACLQFAVSVAPKSMKALITGLYYLFMGIGSFMGTAIISILSSSKIWFYNKNYGNINCRFPCKKNYDDDHSCHLDYYFYLLAGLELIAVLLFTLISYIFGLHRDTLLINARVTDRHTAGGSVQKNEETRKS